jgi:hypothetical protein
MTRTDQRVETLFLWLFMHPPFGHAASGGIPSIDGAPQTLLDGPLLGFWFPTPGSQRAPGLDYG